VRVVATAGHVDHGKSTLVQALTGRDPDRLAEEKARGLTIDLGFAWTTLGGDGDGDGGGDGDGDGRRGGTDVAFVDVPGHARFVKNMLAGVGAVDACLFVVAATEGWKPQSEEHLRILELLGVSDGVVALTKVGLVDDDRRRAARDEVVHRTAGTFLAEAPIVEVDAVAGIGLRDLATAIDALAAAPEPAAPPAPAPATAPAADRPRLWIDRSFVVRGSGTVVTGTLTGGPLRTGEELAVVPGGRPVRVRGLQSLERAHDVVPPGSRVAANLTGASTRDAPRGHALVRPGQWRPTRTADATLTVLASLGHEVTRRGSYAAHVGSGAHRVTIRLLGAARALKPGERGHVRLHLPAELPLVTGDRYVLREDGRGETVGGGEILDVAPVLPASRARPAADVDRFVAERGWVDADDLDAMTGHRRAPTVGRWVVAPDALAATAESVRRAVAAAGPLGLDATALDDRQRAVLPTLTDLGVERGRVTRRGADAEPAPEHPYLAALRAEPFRPPDPAGVDRAQLRDLARRGLAVNCDGVWFAADAIEQAARRIGELLAAHPAGVTASQVRTALGTSRKYALPLLARLDATGVTRRHGDLRVAGPRLGGGGRESNPPSQDHHDHPL
jgi:selenocysteine-specific elongation factor